MSITKYNDDQVISRVLDSMSDGQWHALTKVVSRNKRYVDNGDKSIEEAVESILQKLAGEGYLLPGANQSYRFRLPHLETWRVYRGHIFTNKSKLSTPRYFGGILEDDGWLLAPLRTFDLVHFRAMGSVTPAVVQERIGLLGIASQDEDSLIRVSTMNGSLIYDMIKQWSLEEPVLEITGVRSDTPVRRRELGDLPPRFLDDLCSFYGTFAHTFLRKNMSSIHKHIAERDDVQQRIFMWIIDAIQRYDDTTSIPFAAYLSTMLSRWVFDLNRKSYGRAAADNELKVSRAIDKFESEFGRKPKTVELAALLGEDPETTRQKSASIALVNNLRSMATLDAEGFDLPITSTDNQAQSLDEEINQTLLSAALTTSAESTGNLIGWVAMYEQTWGSGTPSAKSLGVDTKTLAGCQTTLLQDLQQRLADFHR